MERDQIRKVVWCSIAAWVDNFESSFPGLVAGEDVSKWKQDRAVLTGGVVSGIGWDVDTFISATMNQLGWQLSILYSQVTGDGMGTSDALDTYGLELKLRAWAKRWIDTPLKFPEDLINTEELVDGWMAEVFNTVVQ